MSLKMLGHTKSFRHAAAILFTGVATLSLDDTLKKFRIHPIDSFLKPQDFFLEGMGTKIPTDLAFSAVMSSIDCTVSLDIK
mmetsp:Transcript_17812/g.27509  ORF Transcript_17812/g.27509 Transcript_17812/m.27509 type:complete len:81 (-) Transcript_17812:836-1078(-)